MMSAKYKDDYDAIWDDETTWGKGSTTTPTTATGEEQLIATSPKLITTSPIFCFRSFAPPKAIHVGDPPPNDQADPTADECADSTADDCAVFAENSADFTADDRADSIANDRADSTADGRAHSNRPNSVHSFPDDQFGSGAWWCGTAKLSSAARVGSTHAGACGWLWPPP